MSALKNSIKHNGDGSDIMHESDVVDLLHATPRTIRLWRRTRGLPHIKLTAKAILYRRSDLEQWLGQHRVAMVLGGGR